VFQRTIVFPAAVRYHLDVAMPEVGRAQFRPALSRVLVGAWTKLNTDPGQGKALAARTLMARLIPDIEAFVARAP
jgi:hypothetical protein